ncbi:VQ motif-containing protein 11-like protein [Cinnamomum micranthum f. kanehirae]|uniref:VQ motif-containing protein 11-like protein n=1 Tax=Cinnamomum micranthum f. kanehirae TaxID=337451 RepID=A0A443NDA3_9MAGN|nr:VQ motif-containing protein 11-like protein [Cinnamomum micranthum f. kanehirae]
MSFSSSSSAATTKCRCDDGSDSHPLPLSVGWRPHLKRPRLETHRRHRREAPCHRSRPLLRQIAELRWLRPRRRPRQPAFKLHELRHSMRKLEINLGLTSLRGLVLSPRSQPLISLIASPVTPPDWIPFSPINSRRNSFYLQNSPALFIFDVFQGSS